MTGLVTAISPLYLATSAQAASVPPDGTLVIHLSSDPDSASTFHFTVNPGNVAVPVTGNSDSAPQSLPPGATYDISQAVPLGWVYEDGFCDLGPSSTGTQTATGVTGVEIDSGTQTDCFITDLPESPDLSLTKNASPSTFTTAGQTITYTVTATNVGNSTISFVSIKDPMLGGTMNDCVDGHGATATPPIDLDPGGRLRCTGAYQISANDVSAGQVTNTAVAHGFVDEESRIVRTASATIRMFVPPPGSPTLGVTKSSVPASGSTVHLGDQVVYTLAYGNTGTAAASGAALSDALPADLDYVAGSASNSGTYDAATRTLSWPVGSLGVGGNGTVSFTGVVAQTATDGEVLHNVGVITAGSISSPSNPDDVTVSVPSGALTISKAVDKKVAEYGDTLTYSVTVGATGNKNQTHVVVTDALPDGTSYVDGSAACDAPCAASESDGIITWNVGTVAPGTSATVTFQATIDQPKTDKNGGIPAEEITNVAQATFDADPVEQSNAVTTAVAAVLGEVYRKPPAQTPEPAQLPFTGLPLLDLMTMASVAIAVGAFMTRRGQVRPAVVTTPLVEWREG